MKTETVKRNGVKRLFSLKGEPKVVAKGFALGSFVGMLPFPGFQIIISATLASFFRLNKTAAIAGVFNTNLATGVFVFAFNYWLGKKILGIESAFQMPEKIGIGFARTIFEAGSDVFLSLLLGGFITGIFAMILGYYISLTLLTRKIKSPDEH
ncbi:DUF2062 domain-containing protein [Maribellus comscasis]|uniref:DUF2062 domain-containing protein n=1 Tax=Maribellus comscasis TaxID=2681766 RepID=A0A6I6JNK3_9BACT|nr:DUF2062 domain-containing protein [Maribellus comscasis]QGY44536.1 DUF2062 domain-containing protein [Maribellus comscasis]